MNSPFRNLPRNGDGLKHIGSMITDLGRDAGRAVDTMRHSSGIADLRARSRRLMFDSENRNHPFRVYLSPSGNDDEETINGWLKFIVRAGRIGQVDVTGTDAVDDPDSDVWPADPSAVEILLPLDQAAYAIWIEYLVPTAAEPSRARSASIKDSAAPDGDDWPGYPGPCTTEGTICRLIALVDTQTNLELDGPALVRQFIRADEPDWYQACVSVGGTDKVINVPCDGPPFDFDP